jgi:hypothetical protein
MASQEQITELVTKMAEQRSRLLEQVLALSDDVASHVPVGKTGEEQWTVKEQLAHLAEMELNYDSWVEAALREENPSLGGRSAPPAAIPIEEANRHSVQDLVDVLKAERRDTHAQIERLSPEDFDRTATQPMFGTLTVLQWLRSFYRHDRMHMDQVAGREPEYQPRYTGSEPNQRAARIARTAGAPANG